MTTLCFEATGTDFPIKLEQTSAKRFRVTYGKEVTEGLSYSEAASNLGHAIMHDAACRGVLDNAKG